jgi:hypothetical protein
MLGQGIRHLRAIQQACGGGAGIASLGASEQRSISSIFTASSSIAKSYQRVILHAFFKSFCNNSLFFALSF